MSKKLVFFGTDDFSAYALEALLTDGWDVVAIVTKPDSRSGRGRRLQSPVVKQIADSHSIDILQPETLRGFESVLEQYDCKVAVLSAYGKIVPREILKLFTQGIINIHPSILPLHRGASPIEQTILDGDQVAGVSLMKLVEKMDAGPVYAQTKLDLAGNETAPELYESLGKLGSKMMIEKLPSIIDGRLVPIEQDDTLATYAPMIRKTDGAIDWGENAEVIERRVRAYLRWPGSKTQINNCDVIITNGRLAPVDHHRKESGDLKFVKENDIIVVECGKGFYCIERLKPAGKREMTSQEFMAGRKIHN